MRDRLEAEHEAHNVQYPDKQFVGRYRGSIYAAICDRCLLRATLIRLIYPNSIISTSRIPFPSSG